MVRSIIGDYRAFFRELRQCTADAGIDIDGCGLSHLAFRTATLDEYGEVQRRLKPWCRANVENTWNGRPIDKLLLKEPLELDAGYPVSLIELIPPPHRENWPMGLEHLGVVIGDSFDEFTREHRNRFTGQQDQGPYCQPAYITFGNGRTVKFYRHSLQDVVAMEGRPFVSCGEP
ncbi:MAG TPA: VOC family protein [Woeseiaceae bacterium]|nr:VOC family protein [Woeseiaceae bacterium]